MNSKHMEVIVESKSASRKVREGDEVCEKGMKGVGG